MPPRNDALPVEAVPEPTADISSGGAAGDNGPPASKSKIAIPGDGAPFAASQVSTCSGPTLRGLVNGSCEWKRILVIRLRYIGDVILASPFLKALSEACPGASVTFMTDRICAPLLAECPFIDRVLEYDRKGAHRSAASKLALARELRTAGYDAVFVLQRSFSSALFAFATGAPVRVGFDTDCRGPLLTHRVFYDPNRYEAEAFLDNLRILGVNPRRGPLETWEGSGPFPGVRSFLEDMGHGDGRRLAIINPGPDGSPKAWHAPGFARIADFLASTHDMRVVVTWGPGEEEAAGRIVGLASPGSAILAPPTGLADLAFLISKASLMVTTDTGPMHMAVAKGVPTVTLFGPTNPVKWNDPVKMSHEWVKGTPPCWPCDYDRCSKGFVCMKEVMVEGVLETISQVIHGPGPCPETGSGAAAGVSDSAWKDGSAASRQKLRVIDMRAAERYSKCRKILVVQTSSLGEVILLIPSLRALRAALPEATISCLVRPSTAAVLEGQGLADEIVIIEKPSSLLETFRVAGILRKRQFDLALLFHRSFRAAFMAFLAGIPERVGVAVQFRGWILTRRVPNRRSPVQHEMDRDLDLVRAIGFEPGLPDMSLDLTSAVRQTAADRLAGMGIGLDERVLGLWPGAGWASKRWPAGNFAETGRRLLEAGFTDRVMVLWGPGEDAVAREIADSIGPRAMAPAPLIPLDLLSGFLARCDLLITNDTGPMHMANAIGIPLVVIMGPTLPGRWGPVDRAGPPGEPGAGGQEVRVLTGPGTRCGLPCGKKECSRGIEGFGDCLESVRVSDCVSAAAEILKLGNN